MGLGGPLMKSNTNDVYYLDTMLSQLEYYIDYFKTSPLTRTLAVSNQDQYNFNNDLTGFLNSLQAAIPIKMHYIIMRVNDMISPLDFGIGTNKLLIVDENDFVKKVTFINTTNGVSM